MSSWGPRSERMSSWHPRRPYGGAVERGPHPPHLRGDGEARGQGGAHDAAAPRGVVVSWSWEVGGWENLGVGDLNPFRSRDGRVDTMARRDEGGRGPRDGT